MHSLNHTFLSDLNLKTQLLFAWAGNRPYTFYASLPFSILTKVWQKIEAEKVAALLAVPQWHTQLQWPTLTQIRIQQPYVVLPESTDHLVSSGGSSDNPPSTSQTATTPLSSSLRTQTYFRLSFLSVLFSAERNDSRKYVCVRRLLVIVRDLPPRIWHNQFGVKLEMHVSFP